MRRYLLGVDGGNTKTDFLLCDSAGAYVDLLRTGTISHENQSDCFDGAARLLRRHLETLLARNGLNFADVDAIALGLAGADFPFQVAALTRGAQALGIPRCRVANDAVLGIKALSPGGVGVCAVNGTGTVVVGLDGRGETLQIGGVGETCSDRAGGGYIARRALSFAYDAFYRFGAPTALAEGICALMGISGKAAYAETICAPDALQKHMTGIVQLVDRLAQAGDAVAKGLLDTVGDDLGLSIAGCIAGLRFEGAVHVILAGGLWYKLGYQGLLERTKAQVSAHCSQPVRYLLHRAPPAIGGVFWAAELAHPDGLSAAQKLALLDYLTAEEYERIVAESCYNSAKDL